jgi:selenocysteine-specific elongation factor
LTRRFDVVVDLLHDARPLRHGARVRFHQGTAELLGRVALAETVELQPGERAYARIRVEAPAVLTRGDRFILRQYSPSMTIGGGRVLDPSPARSPIRNAAGIARFGRLDGADDDAAMVFVQERRAAGIAADALARRIGLTLDAAVALAGRLAAAGRVVRVKDDLFDGALVRELETRLVTMVGEHHAAQPMSEGLPREEARERLFARAPSALFDAIVAGLQGAGRLAGRDRLAIPGRGVSLSPEETRAQQALDRVYRDAGLAPPDAASAAAAAQVPAPIADRVSKLLLRQKTLVKVDTLLFHAEALERLKQEVKAMKGQGAAAKVDVAGFKERYGISRKYAIPLLEWLDRERVTRRSGDARVVL